MTTPEQIGEVYAKAQSGTSAVELRHAIAQLVKEIPSELHATVPTVSAQAHPLGFFAFRWRHTGGRELRLHVWSRHFHWMQDPYWPIHDHNFSFTSTVLKGSLLNRIYEPSNSAINSRRRWGIYNVSYENDISKLILIKSDVQITPRSSEITSEGQRYSLDAGELHRARLLSDTAITVLATQSPDTMRSPLVIGDGRSASISFQRTAEMHLNVPSAAKALETFLLGDRSTLTRDLGRAVMTPCL